MSTKHNFLSVTTIIKVLYYVHMIDYMRGDAHACLCVVN